MTVEADTAVAISYRFECRKDALRQSQASGIKVTFTVHPQDMPTELYGDAMGCRYLCVLVPLADDDSPRIPEPKTPKREKPAPKAKREKRSWDEMPYPEQAGTLCHDDEFQKFLIARHQHRWDKFDHAEAVGAETAKFVVYDLCKVTSRRDILPGTLAAEVFDRLVKDFRNTQETERLEARLNEGPR